MLTSSICFALALALPFSPALPVQDEQEDAAKVVAECVKKLNDEDWEVRDEGLRGLQELGRKAIPHLRKLVKEKGESLPRKEDVVEALQDLEMDWAESAIKKIFTDGELAGSFEGQCKPVLEDLGAEAEGLLTTLVKSPIRAYDFRVIAARALGDLGKPSAVPGLKEVWKDEFEDQRVRDAAAFAMDTLGDAGPLQTLLKEAKAALDARPENVQALNRLAEIHRHKKEYETTLSYFRKAGKIQPKNFVVDYNIACTLAVMGKKKEALDALQVAVDKGYTHRRWMEKDGDLRSIRDDERFKAILEGMKES